MSPPCLSTWLVENEVPLPRPLAGLTHPALHESVQPVPRPGESGGAENSVGAACLKAVGAASPLESRPF